MPARPTPLAKAGQILGVNHHLGVGAGQLDTLAAQALVNHRPQRVRQRRTVASRPHHPVTPGPLRLPGVEGQRSAGQQGHQLLGFRRWTARVPRLRAVHRRENQTPNHPAQFGDPLFVDVRQRLQRQSAQVEICRALGPVLQALGRGRGKRHPRPRVQQIAGSG